ncbi:MAG: hypothetical protein ACTHU0_15505, partial [Kofleriaceae bacterium]
DAEQYVERWQEFLRGFFDGYIRLNVAGRVAKMQDILMPTEAKAVLIATRLYELVQNFRNFLERIEGLLTDGAIAKLLKNLEHSTLHLVRGLASALGLLYYLDFETVKPFLELFDADEKAPSPDAWAAEAQKFFASISAKLENAGGEAASLRDLLDLSSTKPFAIGGAIGLGYVSFLTTALKATGHHKKVYAVLGGLTLAFLAYEGKLGAGMDVAKELVLDLPRMLPGKDKKAAKLNGQLIGKLVGTFLVDKALLGEDSTIGKRLKTRPMLRIGVEGSLGGSLVGSLLKVLFSRYVLLAERLGDRVKFVHDDIKQFVADERAAKRADLDKAGLGRLNAFRAKSDEVTSFREMVAIMVHLRDRMERDRDAFQASVTAGVAELREDFRALNKVTTAAGFDLDKLGDRELRAVMIQMNAHAFRAVDEILKAIDWLFAEIADDTSIMTILQALGIETGDLANAHESIRRAVEPRMAGFRQEQEKLEKDQADLNAKEKAKQDAKEQRKQDQLDQIKRRMNPWPLRP